MSSIQFETKSWYQIFQLTLDHAAWRQSGQRRSVPASQEVQPATTSLLLPQQQPQRTLFASTLIICCGYCGSAHVVEHRAARGSRRPLGGRKVCWPPATHILLIQSTFSQRDHKGSTSTQVEGKRPQSHMSWATTGVKSTPFGQGLSEVGTPTTRQLEALL